MKKVKQFMAIVLIAWAYAWVNGYDEGWCDRDEGKPHEENKTPPKPSRIHLDEIFKLWKEVKEEVE